MASTVIVTNAFARASYPALKEAKKLNEKDDEKFRLQAMFCKEGVYDHPEVGEIESHPFDIIDALNEVCQSEFNFPIEQVEDVTLLKDEVGVQFPPNFKDGDKVKKKDENGRPIPGEFDDSVAGYWLLNTTSFEQPGVVDHEEDPIDPAKVYAGCWVRLQLEISAYYKDNSPIVSIELLGVQYVYDDESLGSGRGPRPDATKAFGAVKNGNAKTRDAKRMGKPGERPSRPGRPGSNNDTDNKPSRPGRPGRPGDKPSRPSRPTPRKPEKTLVALTDTSIEDLRNEYQMTDDEIVAEGYGEWKETESKPERPSRPSRPTRPSADDKPSRPTPRKPSRPAKPKGPKLVMYDDAEFTYDELIAEGWSEDDIVNSGYGEYDYTDPDQ